MRLPALFSALALTIALSACGGGSAPRAAGASARAYGAQVPPILPRSHGPAPLDFGIDLRPEGGGAETASILVWVSPARAAVVTGQKIALTAFTDDRFGVTWRVSPPAQAIAPSSSFNQAAVIFTAPPKPGIYTATATSMTSPGVSGSATIAVTVGSRDGAPKDGG